MARKRQTTGMPKKDRNKDENLENSGLIDNLLGKPKTRTEREEALNRLIQRSVQIIVGLIVVVIGAVLIYQLAIVPQLSVATVNGDRITVSQFRQRVDFERAIAIQNYNIRYSQLQQQAQIFGMDINQLAQQDQQFMALAQELQSDDILGNRVLDDMIDEILIQQEFNELGLNVDDAQIEFARQEFFGFDPTEASMIGTPATATLSPTPSSTPLVSPTPSPTPLPTNTPTLTPSPTLDPEATAEATAEMTPEVTAEVTEAPTIPPTPTTSQTEAYENYEESIELFEQNVVDAEASRAALELFWEREAVRLAVQDAVVGDIETTLHANARHILVETEEEANEILAALQSGESFALLAQARSSDTGSGQRGGELGWNPVDLYVPEFAEALRTGEIGALLGPVETDFGFHIIQIIAREDREVDETTAQLLAQSIFGTWVQNRREAIEAEDGITINENWPEFLG